MRQPSTDTAAYHLPTPSSHAWGVFERFLLSSILGVTMLPANKGGSCMNVHRRVEFALTDEALLTSLVLDDEVILVSLTGRAPFTH